MSGIDYIGFVYAALIFIGGYAGYDRTGSLISLLSGCLFGGLATFGAYESSGTPPDHTVLIATSAILFGIMGYRFCETHRVYPAGLVALLSGAMFARSLYRHFQ